MVRRRDRAEALYEAVHAAVLAECRSLNEVVKAMLWRERMRVGVPRALEVAEAVGREVRAAYGPHVCS